MTLILPNDIVNDTPANAAPVEENYNAIQQHINTQLINRDGTVAMTGQLTLVGDPVQDDQAARKAYVDAILPVGVMLPWPGVSAPAGRWALCNGASMPIAQFTDLYNVIGTRYGGSGGSFNIPNMAGVVPVGHKAGDARYGVLGNYGGSTKVPIPSHVHTMTHDHADVTSDPANQGHIHTVTVDPAAQTTSDDGAHSHNIRYKEVSPGTFGSGGGWAAVRNSDTGGSIVTGTANSVEHHHSFDVLAQTDNTTSHNQNHTHIVKLAPFTGPTLAASLEITDADGLKTTTDFYAPFVVINYIIRTD